MRPGLQPPCTIPSLCMSLLVGSFFGVTALTPTVNAQQFPITLELATGEWANFGTVHVEADDTGGVVFDVEIDPSVVGPRASVHHLYFNLESRLRRLRVETLDSQARRPYRVHRSHRRLARSGARFDWKIDFGIHQSRSMRKRGHSAGDGVALQNARFRISADMPLAVEDLLPISTTRKGDVVQMALKLHKAKVDGEHVRYVGGLFEPPYIDPPVDTPPSANLPSPEELPPAPPGCHWMIDLLGGSDPVLSCG